jgi:lysophospholipase L1-like esterase
MDFGKSGKVASGMNQQGDREYHGCGVKIFPHWRHHDTVPAKPRNGTRTFVKNPAILFASACLALTPCLAVETSPPTSGSTRVAPPRTDEAKPVVVCFGDSITKRGYPELLGGTLGVEAINAGVAGHSSAAGLRRMRKDVLEKKPDVVVIFFGTNDARVDAPEVFVSADDYQANLDRMVGECRKVGAKVVICTLPPINETAYFTRHETTPYDEAGGAAEIWQSYRAAATAVAAKHKLPLVDLNATLRDEDWLSRDGVHPSEKGCRIIAARIAAAVAPLVKE